VVGNDEEGEEVTDTVAPISEDQAQLVGGRIYEVDIYTTGRKMTEVWDYRAFPNWDIASNVKEIAHEGYFFLDNSLEKPHMEYYPPRAINKITYKVKEVDNGDEKPKEGKGGQKGGQDRSQAWAL
jgi:hypothetical protein